jgi:uncharacterized membrane protein
MAEQTKSSSRFAFIDWTRGLAAIVMLQGHTFHSFTRTDLRDKGPYMLSQFVGGIPPAIFLFLTGITFAFLMHSQDQRGATSGKRVWAALKRSGYLFLIAFLFRFQLYIFGYPFSPASELLKVDVLNCMGLAMLILAPMAVFTTRERIRLCTIVGLVIAALSPVVTQIDDPAIPWLIRSYFFPNVNYFGFFPWASFLAFGMVVGSVIRVVNREEMGRVMLWTFGIGLGTIISAQYLSNLPYSVYSKSDFWLNSPALTLIKLGVVLAILALAYLWVQASSPERWSLVRQFGTTSLLVYWVHIELVYGRWFGFWKESLSVPQVVTYSVFLVALMALLSVLWSNRTTIGGHFQRMRMSGRLSRLSPEPTRSSGD